MAVHQHPRTLSIGFTVAAVWLLLVGMAVGYPYVSSSTNLVDDITRYTVRVSLVYYTAALSLMAWLHGRDPVGPTSVHSLARLLWTLAWLGYIVHVFAAFHYYHDWSHAAAIRHTREVSGFGPGIYVSHLFTAIWSADVLLWWMASASRAKRPNWATWLLHGFMLFIVFCATVVYESGMIRWAGIALFVWLVLVMAAGRTNLGR